MVFNWKYIASIVVLIVVFCVSVYTNINMYTKRKQLEERLEESIALNKEIRSVYDEELSKRDALLKQRNKLVLEWDKENANEPCYNSIIPNNIINRLPK